MFSAVDAIGSLSDPGNRSGGQLSSTTKYTKDTK